MSRCFPFPPPGYEKKARSADLDALLKEKQKERKHRKERKDKSENKEKREKDGNIEKHRDKDQERHKKKRDKHRGKDKQKTTDGHRNVDKLHNSAPCKLVEADRAAEEKKFKDEFTRRITGDGKSAEHQKVMDLTNMDPRQVGGALTERSKINEARENKGCNGAKKSNDAPERFVMRDHATGDKRFSDDFSQRIQSYGKHAEKQLVENFNSMDPRGRDGVSIDRTKGGEVRNKNKDRVCESLLGSMDTLTCNRTVDHTKDKGREKPSEGINRTMEALMGKDNRKERRIQDIDKPKESFKGKENTKDKENTKEGEEKKKERFEGGCQDPDEKRKKPKDRIKDPEKGGEKIISNTGVGQNQIELKSGESGNGLLPGTSSIPAAFLVKGGIDSSAMDPNARKRKELQENGLPHDELRPSKLSKPISGSSSQLKNGFRSETAQINIQSDKRKPGRHVDINTSLVSSDNNQRQKLNGKIEHRPTANNGMPSGSVADNSASLSSFKKEKKLNGKLEHRLIVGKSKSFEVLHGSTQSPAAFDKVHIANGAPDNRSPMNDNMNSQASDTIAMSMNNSEHGRLLPVKNHTSLGSDTVRPGTTNAERNPTPRASDLKKSSDNVGAGASNAEGSRLSPATNLRSSVRDTVGAGKSRAERSRALHPDSQFLSQILAVPKMAELCEFDDQEWLFNSKSLPMNPSFELEIDRTPQVWAEVLHIEAVDTHALPYVIPY